jgi:hypothetical protein
LSRTPHKTPAPRESNIATEELEVERSLVILKNYLGLFTFLKQAACL